MEESNIRMRSIRRAESGQTGRRHFATDTERLKDSDCRPSNMFHENEASLPKFQRREFGLRARQTSFR